METLTAAVGGATFKWQSVPANGLCPLGCHSGCQAAPRGSAQMPPEVLDLNKELPPAALLGWRCWSPRPSVALRRASRPRPPRRGQWPRDGRYELDMYGPAMPLTSPPTCSTGCSSGAVERGSGLDPARSSVTTTGLTSSCPGPGRGSSARR